MTDLKDGKTTSADFVVTYAGQRDAVVLSKVALASRHVMPQTLRTALRERFYIDATLLHDGGLSLGLQGAPVLMEALAPPPEAGFETSSWRLPPNARAWQRPGWFSTAARWLEHVLAARGEHLTGGVQQVGSYDLTCVLCAKTTDGEVYLKASESPAEGDVTAYLARTHPRLVPDVLAWHEARGWLLTRSGGVRLSASADLAAWSDAFGKLARFQRGDSGGLERLGCPIYSFGDLAERAGAFLNDVATLTAWGLRDNQAAALVALTPIVEQAHARVRRLNLPEGPIHGDAQPMNALSGEKGALWFDWSEAGIAHPFTDIGWCLAWIANPAREPLPICLEHREAVPRLWRGYLQALGVRGAEGLVQDAIVLALVHRALAYHAKYERFEGTVLGWRPQYVPYYLRLLLKLTSTSEG